MAGKKRPVHPQNLAGSDGRNPGRKAEGKVRHGAEDRKVHVEQSNMYRRAGTGRQGREELRTNAYRQGREEQRTNAHRQDRMKKRGNANRRGAENHGNVREDRSSRRYTEQNGRGGRIPDRFSQEGMQRHSMDSDRKREKKKHGKSVWRYVTRFFFGILGIGAIGSLLLFLFETRQIVVSGNQYCTEQEVTQWLRQDPYSRNSLYVLWRYNQKEAELPPAVEQVKVVLRSPRKVEVQVKEKVFAGRIEYREQSLYFDRKGVASLVAPDVIEGVPYVEGLEIETEKLRLGEVLPITDKEVFSGIGMLTELLGKRELVPDKITCTGTEITLHFNGIRAQIGSGGFPEKLAQIPPILEKMNGLYAGQTGVLHLENYSVSDGSIRFVPDTAAGG